MESLHAGVEQSEKSGGGADDEEVLKNLSAGIWYWLATSLDTEASSSRKICIRMNGSRPFWVSRCQGLGLASRSLTEPWDKPRTVSPNKRWLIEYWLRASLTRRTRSSVLMSE